MQDNRIAVTFQYEYHDDKGQWFRAHGNENWDFNDNGYMKRRQARLVCQSHLTCRLTALQSAISHLTSILSTHQQSMTRPLQAAC
jgi:Protein of unknown function (DUF1348)